MLKRFIFVSAIAGCGILSAGSTATQGLEGARQEFPDRCAVCRGEEGAGDGVIGDLFAQQPKNLQLLEEENGHVFPYERVYDSIRGNVDVAAHG